MSCGRGSYELFMADTVGYFCRCVRRYGVAAVGSAVVEGLNMIALVMLLILPTLALLTLCIIYMPRNIVIAVFVIAFLFGVLV
jgi:hypothetical protein